MLTSTAISIAFALAHSASNVNLPTDWRYPDDNELNEVERANSPDGYIRVAADLNGDGIEDAAFILKNKVRSSEALWVHLSDAKEGFRWVKIFEIRWESEHQDVPLVMGIDKVEPGVIAYSCFDEAPECNFGPDSERPKLKLSSPSLEYFKMGSASSLFFWSNRHKRFLRVWLSD